MPTYEFTCDDCGHGHEEFLSFKDPLPESCPDCGAASPAFHQVYGGGQLAIVYGGFNTVAHDAERNAKRLGKERCQQMAADEKNRVARARGQLPEGTERLEAPAGNELPWWRSGKVEGLPKMAKPLNLKKVKSRAKYIRTGEAA